MLALLADGESWSSSALGLALGTSQRTVQRALDELAARRQSAVFRARPRAALADAAAARIHDGLVTPHCAGVGLASPHDKFKSRHRSRVRAVRRRRRRAWRHLRRRERLVLLRRPPQRGRSRERQGAAHASTSHRTPEPHSTASTFSDRRETRSTRSIPRPAACCTPFPRRAAAVTPAWPGPKVQFVGRANIARARSARSIRRPARCCARSNRTASSPASPG